MNCLKLDKCILKFCLVFYGLLLNVFPFNAVFHFGKQNVSHGFKTGFGMTVILFVARNSYTQWGDQLHCYDGEHCSLSFTLQVIFVTHFSYRYHGSVIMLVYTVSLTA